MKGGEGCKTKLQMRTRPEKNYMKKSKKDEKSAHVGVTAKPVCQRKQRCSQTNYQGQKSEIFN